jgi:hypothetical protein
MNKIQLHSYPEDTYPKKEPNYFLKNRLLNQHSYGLPKKQNPQEPILLYANFSRTKKKSSQKKSIEGVTDLGYERVNRPVIETSIDKAWGFSTYFFHTLIKQRPIEFFLKNDNTLDLLMKGYFLAEPSDRPRQCKFIAKYLNSVGGILLVLDWSRKKMVKESYDSAVDLLSECGKILLKVIVNEEITSLLTKDIIAYEEKLEVLITGIAFAHSIPSQERLEAITNLIPSSRRLIKAAIIDALLILQDEVNLEILKYHLNSFLSNDEPDEYIRQYAKDALEEL